MIGGPIFGAVEGFSSTGSRSSELCGAWSVNFRSSPLLSFFGLSPGAGLMTLVYERLHGRGDSSAARDQSRRRDAADGHDRRRAEEAAELHAVAGALAGRGDDPHRGRLAV